ncbi:MAG: SDR family oxidoreductase [Steroidobacteraceae bacterium]
MLLNGTLCLVTGAARGIGQATADALATVGARVLVIDIDAAAAQQVATDITTRGGSAYAYACDVANDAQVAALASDITQTHGTPDLLINNAFARQFARGTLDNVDLEIYKRAFDINVLGNIRMHQAFLPGMFERDSGHIVDTASSLSIVPNADTQMLLPYIASKGAILGMAYGMRHALQARGIGYSVFCPGLTDTRPAHEQAIAVHPQAAAPAAHAAQILLAGITRGDFLISSEPDFETRIVRLAQHNLDPLKLFAE